MTKLSMVGTVQSMMLCLAGTFVGLLLLPGCGEAAAPAAPVEMFRVGQSGMDEPHPRYMNT